jgi:hypothetical protein
MTMRLAKVVRLYAAANSIAHSHLAEEWRAPPATVCRFLSGKQTPNGRTMARIIAWLLEDA